jgi:hypothetical protein
MATRGRKPLQPDIQGVDFNDEQARADLADADQLPAMELAVATNQQNVLAQFGDGQPYERLRYIDRCRYHMARSAEEALEVGRCLIVMKECEGHGAWLPVLEEIGVDRKVAARMMQAATRFTNVSSTRHLLDAVHSKTKLFELMVLDDDELTALNDGETVLGLTLDDVERMSVSELRAQLRMARASNDSVAAEAAAKASTMLAAKDKLIAAKSQRISELVEQLNQQEGMTTDERAVLLEERLNAATTDVVKTMIGVRAAIDKIARDDKAGLGLKTAMAGALNRLIVEATEIANDYGVALELVPEWVLPESGDEPTADWMPVQ